MPSILGSSSDEKLSDMILSRKSEQYRLILRFYMSLP